MYNIFFFFFFWNYLILILNQYNNWKKIYYYKSLKLFNEELKKYERLKNTITIFTDLKKLILNIYLKYLSLLF